MISDTHLYEFEQKKFDFLMKLFSDYEKIIINGDFWDGWYWNWDDFIQSKWKGLFTVLQSRDVTYVLGNHDLMENKSAVGLFCTRQVSSYMIRIGGTMYHFEHGHRLSEKVIKSRLFKRYAAFVEAQHRSLLLPMHKFERLVGKLCPEILFNSKAGSKRNGLVKEYFKSNPVKGVDMYVIGDTHSQELDIKNHFANSGPTAYGYAFYMTISDKGIALKQVRY